MTRLYVENRPEVCKRIAVRISKGRSDSPASEGSSVDLGSICRNDRPIRQKDAPTACVVPGSTGKTAHFAQAQSKRQDNLNVFDQAVKRRNPGKSSGLQPQVVKTVMRSNGSFQKELSANKASRAAYPRGVESLLEVATERASLPTVRLSKVSAT